VASTGIATAAVLMAIGRAADPAEARGWWLFTCALGAALVPMGAPWRYYWRGDSTLLARLPIPGDALYRLGAVRGARVAGENLVVLALAASPALFVDAGMFARGLVVAALAVALGVLLAPVAAVVAGSLVTSPSAQRAFDNMTGAGGAPSVVWLSLVPAAAGCLVGAVPYVLLPWLAGTGADTRLGPALPVAAAALAGGGILFLLATPLARRILPEATREVAALDQVRLAHVELDRARGLERWVAAAAGAGRPIFAKDVALTRRRYPSYYLWHGATVIALWVIAFVVDEPTRARWTLGLAAGMAAYTVLLARRLARPPVERPRLLRVLPFPAGAATRAKRVYVGWRALAPVVLGVAPAVARDADPFAIALPAAGVVVTTWVLGAVAVRGDRDP